MRWRTLSSKLAAMEYNRDWQRYFAWFPIRIGDTWTWLEVIERRRIANPWTVRLHQSEWEYRLLAEQMNTAR